MKLPKLPVFDLNNIACFGTQMNWAISDPVKFHSLLDEASKLVEPGFYLGDNLFTWGRNNSWAEDDVFIKAWQANLFTQSDQAIVWRRYITACAAYHAVQLEGDFVECGVYSGSGVKTVVDYLGGTDFPKTFWAYDTFDYNPVEGHAFEGQEAGFYEKIQERFKDYPQVKLIKGLLPDSLKESPEKIAYMHIDLNHAEYEIAVLDALFDRVVPGGMIVLDDYEWAWIYRPQKIAEATWFDQRNYRVFPLPTGQGMVIKR